MEWTSRLKPADTVYIVHRWGQQGPRVSRVAKVGTKWIYLDFGIRFERQTGRADFHSWDLYPSENSYLDSVRVASAWMKLGALFRQRPPAGMTVERIKQIAKSADMPWPWPDEPESAPKKS